MRLWILPSKVLFRWRRWWRSSPLSCLLRLIYSLVSVTPGARPGPGTRHPFTVLRYKTPRCWKRRTAQFRCSGSATLVIRVRRHSVKMFRNSSLRLAHGWMGSHVSSVQASTMYSDVQSTADFPEWCRLLQYLHIVTMVTRHSLEQLGSSCVDVVWTLCHAVWNVWCVGRRVCSRAVNEP